MSETISFSLGRVLPVGLSLGERELFSGRDFRSVPDTSCFVASAARDLGRMAAPRQRLASHGSSGVYFCNDSLKRLWSVLCYLVSWDCSVLFTRVPLTAGRGALA